MIRIALQLTPELVEAACSFVGVDPSEDVFDGATYAIVTAISQTEFNFKLASEDEIFEEAKSDADLKIMTM